jgi:hypothetical protein
MQDTHAHNDTMGKSTNEINMLEIKKFETKNYKSLELEDKKEIYIYLHILI